jgi:cell division protein FtsL
VEDYAMHKNPYLEACPPPKDVKQEIETLEQGISLARTWIDDLKSVLVDVQCKENEINNAKSKKDLRGKMGVK